jgi:DHA1 family multidrug resistance protein-like MFS transporter
MQSMDSWKRNLYIIAVAELVVIMGFSFAQPFMPLYMKQLGNFTDKEAAFWAGLAAGGSGIAMFLSAPVWGILADRLGRKPMLLRAQFGSAVVLALAAVAPNVYIFMALRFIQGMLSGTVPAASALIASQTPREKVPFAMSSLMVAIFCGNTIGPLVGGTIADIFGFRTSFFITAILLSVGGAIILFLVHETFERPEKGKSTSFKQAMRLAGSREILPLLVVVCALNIGPSMMGPMIPLLIDQLAGGTQSAGSAGVVFALIGLVAAGSAFLAGRVAKRIPLKPILIASCIGTGLLYMPPILAGTVAQLVPLLAMTALMNGGIITSSNSLVSYAVPVSQQGIAYGLYQSANSLGGGLGPFLGGAIASGLGLKSVFAVAGVLYIVVGVLVAKMLVSRGVAKEASA